MKLTKKIVTTCFGFVVWIALSSCLPIQQKTTMTPSSETKINAVSSPTTTLQSATAILVSPTMTFMPALPIPDADAKMLELLRDNGGCRLPCFWGFTPGSSSVEMFVSSMHQFNQIDAGIEKDDLLVNLFATTAGEYTTQSDVIRSLDIEMRVYRKLETKDEKVYKNPYYVKYFQYYTLPYLLTNYGPPEQAYIFLDTGIADMGLGIDLYLLHLDYPKQGWVAHFEMPLLHKGNMLLGCPSEAFTKLRLWSPNSPARDYNLDPAILFTLEEATGMTIEEFYQQYKDPTNIKCLETPANIQK